MRFLLPILLMIPTPSFAWERLGDAEIEAALAGRLVIFDAYTFQSFSAQGRTQYVTERAADGFWTSQDGRYCVSWPPSEAQDCYTLERDGDRLRFTSEAGVASVGTYAPE